MIKIRRDIRIFHGVDNGSIRFCIGRASYIIAWQGAASWQRESFQQAEMHQVPIISHHQVDLTEKGGGTKDEMKNGKAGHNEKNRVM